MAQFMPRSLAIAGFLLICLFGPAACQSGGGCTPGNPCQCAGGDQCYIGCDGDGCSQACFSMKHCGTVCGNGCSSDCHDVDDCSQSCGDDCVLHCERTPRCGVICGANCQYDCSNASTCAARVGPGSHVRCAMFSSCSVECTGTCSVDCSGIGCQVTCADHTAAPQCPSGLYQCGGC